MSASALAAPPVSAAPSIEVIPNVTTAVPRLADGVELLGQYQGSGYQEPPYLLRRVDGQVIQLSRLLYLVASAVDGQRDLAAIAASVSRGAGRPVSADNVAYLLDEKLRPRGILTDEGIDGPPPEKANPLLALRARAPLMSARIVDFVASGLQPLFLPAVVAGVLAGVAALDYWVLTVHGLGPGVRQVLNHPVSLLIVLGLSIVAAGFHECGHAAGCRYGGARPGVIGAGIYLVWPAFYTNVTDSYRLSRAGRLRTDLGGLYFNLVFILGLAGLYAATGSEVLLLAIAIIHLEMLEQLLPFVRCDGYFILSDLVGVPDLFARVAPILASVLRRRGVDPRVSGLRRRARILITGWVACVVPLLAFNLGYLLLYLPHIEGALVRSGLTQVHRLADAAGDGRYAETAVYLIAVLVLILPLAGTLYILAGVTVRLTAMARRWSYGARDRQVFAALIGLVAIALLMSYWLIHHEFPL